MLKIGDATTFFPTDTRRSPPKDTDAPARALDLLRDALRRAEARELAALAELDEANAKLREFAWQPIETAPRDGTPILGWCVHAADPFYLEGGDRLTIYAAHVDGMGRVEDGPNVVVWGGAFDELPDWWFRFRSDFEVAANPTHWMPIPEPPAEVTSC